MGTMIEFTRPDGARPKGIWRQPAKGGRGLP